MNYLSVENLSKSFGEKQLFHNISFGLEKGQKVALVAKNGTGKTTLLNILTGKESPDSGKVVTRKGIHVGYLGQEIPFIKGQTILEFVSKNDDKNAVPAQISKENWILECKKMLSRLHLTDHDLIVDSLSGGQLKRAALAKAFLFHPDILILDEPTNHLDIAGLEWLENYLAGSDLTLLVVTHDRYFLDSVADEIIELDGAALHKYKGNYSYFVEKKAEREQAIRGEVMKSRQLFKTELEWLRRMPKARGTKAKSRINAAEDLRQVAATNLRQTQVELEVKTERTGSKILELHNIRLEIGSTLVADQFKYVFRKDEKVGLIGSNGVGKTTFLRLLMNEIEPTKGKVVFGTTIKIGYYAQHIPLRDENQRVLDAVREIAEVIPLNKGKQLSAAQLLERFLFPPNMHFQQISTLSGGEKRKLSLLIVLMANPNFLILDEPTNDLDIQTLCVLEDFLASFAGCVIVVSHDRFFLNKVVDHLFIFQGNGKIKDFPGLYSDYRDSLAQEEKVVKAKAQATSRQKPSSSSNKMTFKEKFELKELDAEIPALEGKKTEIIARLESGSVAHDALHELSAALGKIMASLEEKMDRWLELSERDSGE